MPVTEAQYSRSGRPRSSPVTSGPRWWRNFLNSYRYRRRRRKVLRWYYEHVDIPRRDLVRAINSLVAPLRRYPFLVLPLLLAALWLVWPLLAPRLLPLSMGAARGPEPEVISVFVEDPTRSIWALQLWKQKPGALLVMQGRPSSQLANITYLRSQGLWPADRRSLVTLEPGCDTVGQVAALARMLQQQRRPGQLTMVTSADHLPRTLAIARTVIGPMGWKVDGLAVITQDKRPENGLRLVRDQIRAQMLRFTGFGGSRSDSLCQ
jgi:uncharacterized SAM-binding protein YcdF (DUF218 family)